MILIALLFAVGSLAPVEVSANTITLMPAEQETELFELHPEVDQLEGKRLFFNAKERIASSTDRALQDVKVTDSMPIADVQPEQAISENIQFDALASKPAFVHYNAIVRSSKYIHVILNDLPCKPVFNSNQSEDYSRSETSDSSHSGSYTSTRYQKSNLQCVGIPDDVVSVVLLENERDILILKNNVRLGVLKPGKSL